MLPVQRRIDQSFNGITKKTGQIKINPHYGEPISKKIIPIKYKELFGITNLFWVSLPSFWRMLYTLTQGKSSDEIIAFIVDIIDHNEYG